MVEKKPVWIEQNVYEIQLGNKIQLYFVQIQLRYVFVSHRHFVQSHSISLLFFFSDTIQKAYGPLHRFCLFVFNVELDQITPSSESFNGATLLTTVSSNFSTGPSLLDKICLQHLNCHIILRFLNSRLNGQTPLMTFPLILQKLILNIISLENEMFIFLLF